MKIISRIKKKITYNENEFEGFYKNHHIFIQREPSESSICGYIYYIEVRNEDGIYSYGGYWSGERSDKYYPDMEDAVKEALIGAQLL
ncbi:MAG TPA: hypothetical protein VLB82_07705 [Thermodesulfobacteriota bacterium]|nr:hypothetical protein [Thermodesulfobacteriota bacterium]